MILKESLKIKLKENTRVIVTAGASGIGRKIAETFIFSATN